MSGSMRQSLMYVHWDCLNSSYYFVRYRLGGDTFESEPLMRTREKHYVYVVCNLEFFQGTSVIKHKCTSTSDKP